jgi:hypothetical protein
MVMVTRCSVLFKQQETDNVIYSFTYARRPRVLTKCITMYYHRGTTYTVLLKSRAIFISWAVLLILSINKMFSSGDPEFLREMSPA